MVALGLAGAGYSTAATDSGSLDAARLGRRIFFDESLSASGKMSCATCHDPAHAFGPPNALSVQLGGATLDQPGHRAVPSLKYLQVVPQFTEHFFDSDDDALFRAIARGEFNISGVQNKTLRRFLSGKNSSQVSRLLKRLRLHGLIRKVAHGYKYYLTQFSKQVIATGLKLRELVIIPQLACGQAA